MEPWLKQVLLGHTGVWIVEFGLPSFVAVRVWCCRFCSWSQKTDPLCLHPGTRTRISTLMVQICIQAFRCSRCISLMLYCTSVVSDTGGATAAARGALVGGWRCHRTARVLWVHWFSPQWGQQRFFFFKRAEVESIFRTYRGFVLWGLTQEEPRLRPSKRYIYVARLAVEGAVGVISTHNNYCCYCFITAI